MFVVMDAVQFGPRDDLGYRRPPATATFDDLRRRGLPEVLFVHAFLPEGVTVCDVTVFAAMLEEAHKSPTTLLLDPPDEHGNQLCRGFVGNGLWEWAVVVPGRRTGWRMTLGPERDGQRLVTVEESTIERSRSVIGPVLVSFPISTRPVEAENPVHLGPMEAMEGLKYRRPPATVSFDDLSRKALPRLLFVKAHLPEGVIVCDINVFAAMIKEAYQDGCLRYVRPDEYGNDQCVGIGSTGLWEWGVVRASKPIDGDRYSSPHQGICRIVLAPEKDGKRVCTVDLSGYAGHEPEDDSPIRFTIRTRTVSLVSLERGPAAKDPAEVAEAVDMALTWVADRSPSAAGLLRLLACLPDEPVPVQNLLFADKFARLPGPETGDAAALIGPLLGNPMAVHEAMGYLTGHLSLLRHTGAGQQQLHPLARAAVRAQLTAEETAHWQQAAAALVEAAMTADPKARAAWPTYSTLLPHARDALELTADGMRQLARYLGESGDYRAARDQWRLIADAHTAAGAYGPDHPRTLAARRELARWTGEAGDAAGARDELAALLPVTERVHGAGHPDTLAVRRDLAHWTGEAGDAPGARDQCVALLPVTERVEGLDHPHALAVRCEIARWTGEAGDWAAARDQCVALLPVFQEVLGPSHPDVVLTLREFPKVTGLEQARASTRYQFGLLQRVYERLLGGDHLDTLAVSASLLSAVGEAGDARIPRNHLPRVLQHHERILGSDHPVTLRTRHDLARWTGEAGDAAGARDQFAALLPVTERVLGPDHPRTQTTRANLAHWTERAAS